MTDLRIRRAIAGEEGLVLALLRELADYEKLLDVFHIDQDVIRRDYLGEAPLCHADLAFAGDAPVGIATWYWKYASFAARRVIHLEDLFVRPAFRGHGHGLALLRHLAKKAVAVNGAVDWFVLDWNTPSIAFYDGIGAKPVAGWLAYRLEGEAAKTLAAGA
jgi:GNAT superfamily N-acetyltransferase